MNIERKIQQIFGSAITIKSHAGVAGGDINDNAVLTLSDGQKVFVKQNVSDLENMFAAEASALERIRQVHQKGSTPPVPQVYGWGSDGQKSWLMMEFIVSGRLKSASDFGRSLAAMHREGRSDLCGWHMDNWIGTTAQINSKTENWIKFFRDMRLSYQWDLARKNGFGNPEIDRDMQSLMARIEDIIPPLDSGGPSLLHGDLWGGNWIAGFDGVAWLIDPAAYYGHREADIAMTQLFGGFPKGFYDGYNEEWPLLPGFSERKDIYNLYHLLNHANLFGSSYWSGVCGIIKTYR